MGMAVGKSAGVKSDINVTPLVDVVLVLLIIFMVITPLVQMGYDLQIPRKVTSTQSIPTQSDQVILRVEQDEAAVRIYINKEEIGRDDLGTRLEGIYKGKLDKIMFLSADRAVNYGEVMQIVDIARKAGGDSLKIGLVTDEKVGASEPAPETAAATGM